MDNTMIPSKKDILEELERICNHPDFKSKAQLCRFLNYVVNETLAGRGEHLKGYTIAIEVLGKDQDFDPEQDSLVRIHAGRLRRLLKEYYHESGSEDEVIIQIPKGTYQPQFFLKGSISNRKEKKEHPSDSPFDPTVAVFPFKNLTGDSTKDYFSHGFSEQISIKLTNFEDIKVISCWQRPQADEPDFSDLYEHYRARFIVDGGVLINGMQVEILIKLIDTLTRQQIWADSYSADLSIENIIAIEEKIANTVAGIIGGELGIIFRHLTRESTRIKSNKLDVYEAILHFYYYEANQSLELAKKTFNILREALSSDPESGIINAMLATMYGNRHALDFPGNENALEKMDILTKKALALEPDNQLIRLVIVFRHFLHNDRDGFFKEVEHCLSTNISSPLRRGALGFHLSLFGEWERGKVLLDQAMNQHGSYPLYFHGATCLYHYRIKKYQKALEEARKYDIPGLFWGYMLRASCHGQLNQLEEAQVQYQELKKLKPDFESKASELINRFVKEEELIHHILNGLEKAEIEIP